MKGPSLMSLSIPGNAALACMQCVTLFVVAKLQDIFSNFMTVKCSEDLWECLCYVN